MCQLSAVQEFKTEVISFFINVSLYKICWFHFSIVLTTLLPEIHQDCCVNDGFPGCKAMWSPSENLRSQKLLFIPHPSIPCYKYGCKTFALVVLPVCLQNLTQINVDL